MHTRRGGACRAGEKRSSFQQARSTLPYSLSRPLAYLLPIFWPAAQSSSAMHARVYREESCLKGREKWRGKKPGRTAEFPSSRFIIRPTRVFHLPSPLPPFLLLLLLSLSPCSLVISCLTFFYVYSTGCRSEGFSCSKTLINEPSTRSFPSFLSSPRSHPSVTTVKAEDLSPSLFGAHPPLGRSPSVPQLSTLGHTIDRYPFPLEGRRWIFARQQDISGGNRPATLIDTGTVVTSFTAS